MKRAHTLFASALLVLPMICGCGGEAPQGPADKRTPEELKKETEEIDAAHAQVKKAHDAAAAKQK